jgi:hypothetical protein
MSKAISVTRHFEPDPQAQIRALNLLLRCDVVAVIKSQKPPGVQTANERVKDEQVYQ